MAGEVKTEFKIPDLWYDFYARLIPGTVFIVALRVLNFNNKTAPETNEMFTLLGAAYFAGLMTQPLASRLVEKIDDLAQWFYEKGKNPYKEEKWVRKLQFQLGRTTRDSLILSKMHGETTMFVQMGVLAIVFLIQNKLRLFQNLGETYKEYTPCLVAIIFTVFFSFLGSFEVAHRRLKRAGDIKKYFDDGLIKSAM